MKIANDGVNKVIIFFKALDVIFSTSWFKAGTLAFGALNMEELIFPAFYKLARERFSCLMFVAALFFTSLLMGKTFSSDRDFIIDFLLEE